MPTVTSLTVHHEAYKLHLSAHKDALTAAKSAYFSTIINDSNRNPRALFSTVNNLLKPRADSLSTSTPEQFNSFLKFFADQLLINPCALRLIQLPLLQPLSSPSLLTSLPLTPISASPGLHSTETVILKVLNDLTSGDTGALNILIDLSAAFDTTGNLGVILDPTLSLKPPCPPI
ncbi:unnamed protein product [Lota lota]